MASTTERARRDLEDDAREYFARLHREPHSLIEVLRGLADHNRGLAEDADARGDWATASHLRSRAWAMDDMVDASAVWLAENVEIVDETEAERAFACGDR